MSNMVKKGFLWNVSFLILKSWIFVSENNQMEKIVSFHDKYKIYDDANIYIYDKLINKKKMHYILLKKHISSIDHSSSQRSESLKVISRVSVHWIVRWEVGIFFNWWLGWIDVFKYLN